MINCLCIGNVVVRYCIRIAFSMLIYILRCCQSLGDGRHDFSMDKRLDIDHPPWTDNTTSLGIWSRSSSGLMTLLRAAALLSRLIP